MTNHIDPIEAWAGIAEAAGINTLAACIELVRAAGYTVSKPKAKPVKTEFRNDLMPAHKTAMRKWERTIITWTFADGTAVRSYALRESASKAWFLGSSLRAACDKYRYKHDRPVIGYEVLGFIGYTDEDGEFIDPIGPTNFKLYGPATSIDLIEVPEVIGCSLEECEISSANAYSEGYRKADKDRPRKLFEGTAHL